MKNKGNRKILLLTIIGSVIEFLVVFFTGLFGATPVVQGFLNAMKQYWLVWSWQDTSTIGVVTLVFLGFSTFLLLVNLVLTIMRKKPILLLTALCLFLAMAFIPFLFLLAFPMSESGQLETPGLVVLCPLLIGNLISIYFLMKPFNGFYEVVKEKEAPAPAPFKGLSELEIRGIVEDYIELHEEEMHKNQPAPAKEPAPVEEPAPAEEPAQEEEPVEEETEEEEEVVLAAEGEESND